MTPVTLTEEYKDKIVTSLTDKSYPAPTDITIKENILRYTPNTGARNAMIGTIHLEAAGLNVAYDGDPSTTECGIDYDTNPISVVIMVQSPLFKAKE